MNSAKRADLIRERYIARRGPAFLLPRGVPKIEPPAIPKAIGYNQDSLGPMYGGRKPEPLKVKPKRERITVAVARVKRKSPLTIMTQKLLGKREAHGAMRLLKK